MLIKHATWIRQEVRQTTLGDGNETAERAKWLLRGEELVGLDMQLQFSV